MLSFHLKTPVASGVILQQWIGTENNKALFWNSNSLKDQCKHYAMSFLTHQSVTGDSHTSLQQ